ncbi:hypothetical protein CSOJ01_01934 [Colletotrichum sojae]|uniref:Uncharacterized protein n=1 Tax=Colletotrichum sojae TaxID=2175907 RepID=A0A8H6JSN5_9PEZI|nr:hypothetical protein CSOJ01_01934 [Colletotrichum sojae]
MKPRLLKSFLGLTKSPIQASRAGQGTRGQCKRHRFKAHAALPADIRGEASKRWNVVDNSVPARDVSDASNASGNRGALKAHAALPADVRGEASKRRDVVGNCLPALDVSDASDASGNCGRILAAMTVRQLPTQSGAEQEGDELVNKRPVNCMYCRSIGVQEDRIKTEVQSALPAQRSHEGECEESDAERSGAGRSDATC